MIDIEMCQELRDPPHGLEDREDLGRVDVLLGDARAIGNGVFEMRVHYGPGGYRLYCLRDSIERAGQLAKDWRQT